MGSFSLVHWIIVAVIAATTALLIRGLWRLIFPPKGPPLVCTTCGHLGPAKSHTRGSMLIEIVLWLMLLVPGLIYSLWRLSTRRKVCSACGGIALVPPDTPTGKKLLRDAAATIP